MVVSAVSAVSSAQGPVRVTGDRWVEASVQPSPVRLCVIRTKSWRLSSFWRDLPGRHRRGGRERGAISGVESDRRRKQMRACQGRESESSSVAFEGSVSRESYQEDWLPDSHNGRFFYNELREAALAGRELSQAAEFSSPLHPGPAKEEERNPDAGVACDEVSPNAEGGFQTSDFDVWQGRDKFGPGKLPIAANGLPMVVLQSYLAPEGPQLKPRERLRPLPLPMPHKLRPPGLPRASPRRRAIAALSRKAVPTGQRRDFGNRDLAADIGALPTSAPVSRVLKKWAGQLKRGSLARTVRELGRAQLKERALQVVLWMQKHSHIWPDHTSLCALIDVMVEAGEVDTAFELRRALGAESARPAQALASALARAGWVADAMEVLKHMRRCGWTIDGSVHAKMVQWACRVGDRAAVERLLGDIRSLELKLGVHDYVTVMAACGEAGLVHAAESVYSLFERSGLRPDVKLFTARLSVLAKAGKHAEAMSQFAKMKELGCAPDLLTYRAMLDVCARVGDLASAMKVFADLSEAGYEAAPEILDTLVQLHVEVGLTGAANGLLGTMRSKGFVPSARTLARASAAADGRAAHPSESQAC